MKGMAFARVAVEKTTYRFDQAFDYAIPKEFRETLVPGMRVLVPFGRSNVKRIALVLEVLSESTAQNLKSIHAVLDQAPLLHEEMLSLVYWLKERTFCTLYDAAQLILPKGIQLKQIVSYKAKTDIETEKIEYLSSEEKEVYTYLIHRKHFVRSENIEKALGYNSLSKVFSALVEKEFIELEKETIQHTGDVTLQMARLVLSQEELENANISLTKKQQTVVILLEEMGSASVKEICYYLGITISVINTLYKKGVIEIYDIPTYRTPKQMAQQTKEDKDIVLTKVQNDAYLSLAKQLKEGYSTSLLYGVTGSGKTQVFLKLIDDVIDSGKTVIVMVPEIALTPQTVALFQERFGKKVATLHSALSIGERMDEFKRIREGKASIVVGTRSAVFAPLENLGLIIMDEEQEATYKSERSPRYHARDVAKFRSAYHKSPLLLVSATPSIETYAAAKNGQYALYEIHERYGEAQLPEVITVDMREELHKGMDGSISTALLQALEENLQEGRQSILLINRRGYQTFVSCQSCGEVVTCPHCSISMTYHVANGRLICHYCGHSEKYTTKCSFCGEDDVRYAGFGTQRVEEELQLLLPKAKVLRMDTDTTTVRYAHEKALQQFSEKAYDILLGTQMVAKGLDFENVTLVGIINADQQLYNDDYRSLERTFSLLTQVIGRSGRGQYKGKAIIQTMTPENPVIQLAKRQDYQGFYKTEIENRRLMIYPPFCSICLIGFVGKKDELVKKASFTFLQELKKSTKTKFKGEKIIVLGPMPSRIEKAHDKYRYQLMIKCHNHKAFRQMISELMIDLMNKSEYKDVTIFADINPLGTF